REEGFELLEQLALLEPLVDRLVFRAARLVVLDLDHIVLQHGRRLRRSRSTRNEAAEDQRQSTNGGTSGRDAVHGGHLRFRFIMRRVRNGVSRPAAVTVNDLTQELSPGSTWCSAPSSAFPCRAEAGWSLCMRAALSHNRWCRRAPPSASPGR